MSKGVKSARLSITANQFCFETGCFVYNLDVLWPVGGIFQTANNGFELTKVTKHKLAGNEPSTCMSYSYRDKNVILKEKSTTYELVASL